MGGEALGPAKAELPSVGECQRVEAGRGLVLLIEEMGRVRGLMDRKLGKQITFEM